MQQDDDLHHDDADPPVDPDQPDPDDDVTPTPGPDDEPEEPDQPDQEDEGDPDTDSDEEEEPEQPPAKGKSKRAYRRQISGLKRENSELRQRLDALEERIPDKPREPELKEPKREDFDSVEDYLEAKSDYKLEVKLRERDRKEQQQSQQERVIQQQRQLAQSWTEKMEDARDAYEDFDDVLETSEVPVTDTMATFFAESEIGADVAYHIAQDPEYRKLARMSPLRQAAELGRIEDKVKAQLNKPKARKPSNAPPPPEPVKPKGKTDKGPSEKDNIDDWMKKRRKQVHGK